MESSIHSISCEKWEGAGNDFLIVDDLLLTPEQIQKVCHRQYGVGADGVIVCSKEPGVLCRMRIFNADGGEAAMCGNGLRALFAYGGWESGEIAVGANRFYCWKSANGISTKLGPPKLLEVCEAYTLVDTGVPHAVLFAGLDVEKARHRLNANVTWVEEGRVHTFERGVEAVTLACGTGIAAAHVALYERGRAGVQESMTSAGGARFSSFLQTSNKNVFNVILEAGASPVFSGKVFLECGILRVRENTPGACHEVRNSERGQRSRI
jgi:diaminopimelate epimerase